MTEVACGNNSSGLEWTAGTQRVNCLRDTTYLEIKSLIDVIHLEDGCEVTSASLVLPGHSRLVKEDNYLTKTHTVAFKLKYTTLQDFHLIRQIMSRQLTPHELEKIGQSIPEPQTSSITELQG